MELALSIISYTVIVVIVTILATMIGANAIKKAHYREEVLEKEAKVKKVVAMDGVLMRFMLVGDVFTLIIGVVVSIPQLYESLFPETEILVMAVICPIVWIVAIFVTVMIYLMSLKVYYGDDGFVVVNAFGKRRGYQRNDVLEISGEKNRRIKLKNGSFILFNAMSGLQPFLVYLKG